MIDALFLEQAARLLEEGGQLYIQTDVEDRAVEYRDQIAAHGGFALHNEAGFIGKNPFGVRSNREARADEDGLPFWRILARRNHIR